MRLILLVSLFWCNTAVALSTGCGEKATEQGYCESAEKVVWCEQQVLHSLECKKGTTCAWNEALQAFDCVSVTEECVVDGQQVLLTGTCLENNTVVRWCDNGKIKILTCPSGTICGWNDSIGMMDCVKDSCLDVPLNGVCIDTDRAVQWCDDGKLVEKTCDEGESCTFDKDANRWDCLEIEDNGFSEPNPSADGEDVSLTPPGKDDSGSSPESGTDNKADGGCAAAPGPMSDTAFWILLLSIAALYLRRQKSAKTSLVI